VNHWCKSLLFAALALWAARGSVGWAAECSKTEIASAAVETSHARKALIALPIGDGSETDVSKTAQRAISQMKSRLAEFVGAYMRCSPPTRSAAAIGRDLSRLVHAYRPRLTPSVRPSSDVPADVGRYGSELRIKAQQWGGGPQALVGITAEFSTECGVDAALFVFRPDSEGWTEALRWTSKPYKIVGGAFGSDHVTEALGIRRAAGMSSPKRSRPGAARLGRPLAMPRCGLGRSRAPPKSCTKAKKRCIGVAMTWGVSGQDRPYSRCVFTAGASTTECTIAFGSGVSGSWATRSGAFSPWRSRLEILPMSGSSHRGGLPRGGHRPMRAPASKPSTTSLKGFTASTSIPSADARIGGTTIRSGCSMTVPTRRGHIFFRWSGRGCSS
jgi:hypothetical protein